MNFTYNGKEIAFAGKDVKELQIVDVQKPDEIKVEKGTKDDDLNLPSCLTVELEGGQTTNGLTNQNNVEASVVVIVGKGFPCKDVDDTDWFYQDVVKMYENGLMTGMDGETFAPSRNLARDQFTVILWRMEGSPDMKYTQEFPDVLEGVWYTDAVLWVSEQGIAKDMMSARRQNLVHIKMQRLLFPDLCKNMRNKRELRVPES